jgi:monoamine oxidase
VFRAGQRSVVPAGTEVPGAAGALSAEERALGFLERFAHYFGPRDTGEPFTPAWYTPERAAFDRVSLADYLAERHASRAFTEEVASSIGMGESAAEMSAMWIMEQIAAIRHEMTAPRLGRITGGTDRFPHALAARLGERVRTGAVVRAVRVDDAGARVRFERNGSLEELAADRVVVAVHGPVVREIAFEPALSGELREAFARLRIASAARGWMQLDRRVWADAGVAGGADTDEEFGLVREDADLQPRASGILSFYVTGERARALRALGAAERREHFVALVERAHPGAREHVVAVETKFWDEDPYARGAHAWMPVEYMTRWLPVLARPHGRLHFAGDYTSYRPGFMHGALSAALRVVDEVLRGGRRPERVP